MGFRALRGRFSYAVVQGLHDDPHQPALARGADDSWHEETNIVVPTAYEHSIPKTEFK